MVKAPEKVIRPRVQHKVKKERIFKAQDMGADLSRTKPYNSRIGSFKDDSKELLAKTTNQASFSTPASSHGSRLSSRTIAKLSAFKYNANSSSSPSSAYQSDFLATRHDIAKADHHRSDGTRDTIRGAVPDLEAKHMECFNSFDHPERQIEGLQASFRIENTIPMEDFHSIASPTPARDADEQSIPFLTLAGCHRSTSDVTPRVTIEKAVLLSSPKQSINSPAFTTLQEKPLLNQVELATGRFETFYGTKDKDYCRIYSGDDGMSSGEIFNNNSNLHVSSKWRASVNSGAETTLDCTTRTELLTELLPELNDDFPMDPGDVEDMLQLSAVQESFEPSRNPDFPFDDNSKPNDMYDSPLQRSRLSLEKSVYTVYKDGEIIPVVAKPTIEAFLTPPLPPCSSYSTAFSLGTTEHDADLMNIDYRKDEDFLEDDDELELLELTAEASSDFQTLSPAQPATTPSAPKLQWNSPTLYKPTQSSFTLTQMSSPTKLAKLPSIPAATFSSATQSISTSQPELETGPVATTSSNDRYQSCQKPHNVFFDFDGKPVPFARPSFPEPVRDRSPIIGLSRSMVLRTCFRIGEAINATAAASKSNIDAIIELYAHVMHSERVGTGLIQCFQLSDLFSSERPPFLSGTYDKWKGVDLFDNDSKVFLGDNGKGRMARVVGTMKRDFRSKEWKMSILSIWEATWEDVEFVKGIVCS